MPPIAWAENATRGGAATAVSPSVSERVVRSSDS